MKINLHKGLLSAMVLGLMSSMSISQTTTFSYTGSMQTYVVPAGVTSIQIEVKGAQGGNGIGFSGGLGATMQGDFAVTPGQVLDILVGEMPLGSNGGGGGTFVVDNITNSPLIIAGGGGGGSGDCCGSGGQGDGMDGVITTDGTSPIGPSCSPGIGGAAEAGGTGGDAGNFGSGGGGGFTTNGGDGELFNSGGKSYINGGAGGIGYAGTFGGYGGGGGYQQNGVWVLGAGGGGGGYSGGGGNCGFDDWGYGGGGGSYNIGTSQVNVSGINTGDGQVIITVLCDGLVTTVSSDSICDGEEVTLAATSTNGGTISWDGGITDGVAFAPSVGTTTYTATSTATEDCDFVIDIFVGALPTVDAGTDVNLCEGDTVLLHGMGTATDWFWDGGITDSVYFTPGAAGTTTYTLTGTIDSTGCMAMDMVDVTYNVIDPSVTVTGVTLTAAQAGATYQWVNCPSFSLIGGATNQAFAPSQDGSYAVIINLNGCVDTSACETIAGVGISDLDNLAIKVLPNPNNGTFQLSLGQAIDGTIVIFGLDGKIIRSEAIAQRTNIDFSFENLDAGVYMMQLNTALGNSTVRIVVQ